MKFAKFWPRAQRAYVRQLIIDVISATDMAVHHDVTSTLKALPRELAALAAARDGAPPPAEPKEAKEWAARLTKRRSELLRAERPQHDALARWHALAPAESRLWMRRHAHESMAHRALRNRL